MNADIDEGMKILRGCIEGFEARVASGTESPEAVMRTVIAVVGAVLAHGRPPSTSKKPPRGLGYGKTVNGILEPDDAMIVASLPWYGGNMTAAISAHYPEFNADEVRVCARRIRDQGAEIRAAIGDDHPWETSRNWLGDLISE
jgi:hypothetical protein